MAIRHQSRQSIALVAMALVCCLLALVAARAQAENLPDVLTRFPSDGVPGEGGGQVRGAFGIAVNQSTGHIFVSDSGNRRVSEFTPWGEFVKAFGWGVVASGPGNKPRNERQSVTVDATGGSFSLLYNNALADGGVNQQATAAIAFDATAGAVQQALEALEPLHPGDVSVSGAPGGPWTIEFLGRLEDSDVPPLQIVNSSLTGGAASATVETVQPGANFEVCVAADGDVCRAGQPLRTSPSIKGSAGPGMLTGPNGIAVDGSGNVYVFDRRAEGEKNARVQKFSAAGEFLLMWGGEVNKTTGANICSLTDLQAGDECGAGAIGTGPGEFTNTAFGAYIAVGADGTVYVGDTNRIQKFEGDGVYVGEISTPVTGDTGSLGVDPTSGDLYYGHANFFVLPEIRKPNLYRLDADSGAVLDVLDEVEPDDPVTPFYPLAVTVDSSGGVYAVDVGTRPYALADILMVKFDPVGNLTIPRAARFGEGSESPRALATSAACDVPSDHLHASFAPRLGEGSSYVEVFGPPPQDLDACPPPIRPPSIDAQYAVSVGVDEAVLQGEINPRFWPDTTYRLQYGTSECRDSGWEAGCTELPPAPGSVLTSKIVNLPLATEGIALSDLEAGTTYHYRLIAESSGGGPVKGRGGTEAEDGESASFTTLPPPAAAKVDCPNQAFRSGASAHLPSCRAYEMVSPVDKNNGDIETRTSLLDYPAALNLSSADGDQITYSSATAFADAVSAPYTSQYRARRDPASGWITRAISAPRDRHIIPPGSQTEVRFDLAFKAFSADLSEGWLVHETDPPLDSCAVEGFLNLYRRNGDGSYRALTTAEPPNKSAAAYLPELQGVSSDGRQAIFRANDRLLPGAAAIGGYQVYEHVAGPGCGTLRLVSVLPNGSASSLPSSAGTANATLIEGRENLVANAVSADGSKVFWTAAESGPGTIYVRIGAKETVTVSGSGSRFWTAAADGSRAIFTTGANLFAFSVPEKKATLLASNVIGLVGASDDASRVYFVSTAALTGGAESGQPNLYLADGGTITFIATIASADVSVNSPFSIVNEKPVKRTTRVTPDGNHIAFTSVRSLTGQENLGADSGEPSAQVFLYDADEERLNCISCNATGARPAARVVEGVNNVSIGVAAQIPPWQNQLHASRVLSDDGARLFFESFDPLVPRDTNGRQDVYEWVRATDAEECEKEFGAELFVASAGGCISLISSGESPQDSELADANPNGLNVFFKTNASLLPQDPGLVDIYNARAGGGLPPPPAPAPPCEGEACQSPPPPPPATAPSSSVFQGAGNPQRDRCGHFARKVRKLSKRAKRLARAARAVRNSRNARRLRSRASRLNRQAGQARQRARTCRKARGAAR